MKNPRIALSGLILFSSINLKAQYPALTWAKGIGGTLSDFSNAIEVDAAGNVYTTGAFKGTVDFDPNSGVYNLTTPTPTYDDVFVSKLDAAGNFLWAKRMGGIQVEQGYDMAVDAAGNVYTTGIFQGTVDFDPDSGTYNLNSANNSHDLFISKMDSSGHLLWAISLGDSADDVGNSIVVDESGFVYTTGFYEGTIDFDPGPGTFNLVSGVFADAFVLKMDLSGNLIWAKNLGGFAIENGNSIAVDRAGCVYTLGVFQNTADFDPDSLNSFNITAAGVYDIFISKLDASGNFVWAKSVGGASYDHGTSMTLDADANIFITGTFQDSADFNPGPGFFNLATTLHSQDIFIEKLDSSGNFIWAHSMGSASSDQGNGIATDAAGNVYTTGFFFDTLDFDPGPGIRNLVASAADIFIQKLDASGNFVWAINMGANYSDQGNSITVDAAGNVYTTGEFLQSTDFDPNAGTAVLVSHGVHDIFIQKLSQTLTGINDPASSGLFQIYPNPSPGIIHYTGPANLNGSIVKVYNTYGQLVNETELKNNQASLPDLSEQANGLYTMTIANESEMHIARVLIQR